MQRYFVSIDQINEQSISLGGEDAYHISRVLRMKEGDEILCCDDGGKTALCEIQEITNDFVQAIIVKWIDENKELPVYVTIAQGLPKGDKLDLVVQKGTELGASSFLPFFASRSIVKWDEKKGRKKVERLQKIAKEAAEQSHRTKIPMIESPMGLNELLIDAARYNVKLVAFEEEAKSGTKRSELVRALQRMQPGESILVVFGPEGGLTQEEVDKLTQHGFLSVNLGPRILRTETAPLYVLSTISYQTELLE